MHSKSNSLPCPPPSVCSHSNIYAIPLSRAAVFGAAVAFAAQNLLRATPPRGFPSQFAWDVIAMMEPMTLLGTAIGVRLNKMSPQWAIVILLVAVLGSAAWETWKKAVAKNIEEDERDALLHRAPCSSLWCCGQSR